MEWAQHGDFNLAVEMDAQWRYDALKTLARSDLVDHQQAYVRLNKLDTHTRMAVFKEVEEWVCRNALNASLHDGKEEYDLLTHLTISISLEGGLVGPERVSRQQATTRDDPTSDSRKAYEEQYA